MDTGKVRQEMRGIGFTFHLPCPRYSGPLTPLLLRQLGYGKPKLYLPFPFKHSSLIEGFKAAFLFWFFGDFRCGALLFMVIHVIYKYKNR